MTGCRLCLSYSGWAKQLKVKGSFTNVITDSMFPHIGSELECVAYSSTC